MIITEHTITDMIGKTTVQVEQTDFGHTDNLIFYMDDGTIFRMFHDQDCCESVYLADVVGDFDDLLGHPLLVAQGRTGKPPEEDDDSESSTWTYYNFATIRGHVHLRWYGTSNGYYSETACICELTPKEYQKLARSTVAEE